MDPDALLVHSLVDSTLPFPVRHLGNSYNAFDKLDEITNAIKSHQAMAYAIAGTECKDVSFAQSDPARAVKALHGPKSRSFFVFHRIVFLLHKQLGINNLLWLHEMVVSHKRVQRELTFYIGPPVEVDAYKWGACSGVVNTVLLFK